MFNYSKKLNFFSILIISLIFSLNSKSFELQKFDEHLKADNFITQGKCYEAEALLLSLEKASLYPREYNDYNSLTYFFLVESLLCQKKFKEGLFYLDIMMDWNKKNISPEYNVINVLNHLNYAFIKIHFNEYQEAFSIATYVGAGILKHNLYWKDDLSYKVKFEDEVFNYHNFMIHKLLDLLHTLKNHLVKNELYDVKDDLNFCYDRYRNDSPLVCNKKKHRGNLLELIDNDIFLYSQMDPWNQVNNIFRINSLKSVNEYHEGVLSKKDLNQFSYLNRLETIYLNKRKRGASNIELEHLEKRIFKIYNKIENKLSKFNYGSLGLLMSIPPISLESHIDSDEMVIYIKFTNQEGIYESQRKLYTFISSDTWGGKKHKRPSTWLYKGSQSENNLFLEKIVQFKENISNPYSTFDKTLSNQIFKTIINEKDIFLKKRISFIVDENLINLPFNALMKDNAEFLHQNHEISVYTSPLHYVQSKTKKQNEYKYDFIGFGDPKFNSYTSSTNQINLNTLRNSIPQSSDNFFEKVPNLPETRQEILEIANLFTNTKIFLDEEANEINFSTLENSSAKYLSIATHSLLSGELNEVNEPTILLTPLNNQDERNDGLLTSTSISNLKLNFDLVALSACNTYAAEDKNSQSLSGLTNAFFIAGVHSIVASMWSVDSETTRDFMINFYLNLSKGYSKSKSLQNAIISSKENFNHPFYWAPFVLIGE